MTGPTKEGRREHLFPDPVETIGSGEAPRRLTVWMLRVDGSEPRFRFVHGNVLPSRSEGELGVWSSGEIWRFSNRMRLFRHSILVDPTLCERVLRSVESGEAFYDALEHHEIAPTGLGDSDLTSMVLHRLPTVYFGGAERRDALPPHLWSRTSPVQNAGCYCARFARSDRFEFLPTDAEQSETLLPLLCDALKPETGISFSPGAGDAFGSLEVYEFPALDRSERPRVRTTYERPPSRALTLQIMRDDPHAEYAIHVRGEQVRDIASDELLILDHGTSEVRVALPEPLDGVEIRVWKRRKGEQWLLWHEQEDHFIRAFSTRIQLGGLAGTVGASWLDRLSKRLAPRVERFKQIRQVSHNQPMETSTRETWETKIQKARELVAQARPPRSKSRYFRGGWGTDEGKFELAEWLKEKLSSHGGSIVVADPYFDVIGLDLICRASGAAGEFVVLTCTQAHSEDDDTSSSGRAARLKTGASQYVAILRGLNLRICDLRSANSGTTNKRLFHDRYLLLFDRNDNPVEGYSLSTSLQSAATTSPLLVAEIPRDVLDDVAEYVRSLLAPNQERRLEVLFPPIELTRRPRSLGLTENRAAAIVAAMEVVGRDTGAGTPVEKVTTLNIYENDRLKLGFSDEEVARLGYFLATAPLPGASRVWEGMVESALAGWRGGVPPLVEQLLLYRDQGVTSFMARFLAGHATGELKAEDSLTYTRTLAHVLERPFPEAVHEAAKFYDYHHDLPIGTSWSIRLAFIYLILTGPESLDGLIRLLREELRQATATLADQDGPKENRPSRERAELAANVIGNADAILSAVSTTLTWFVHPSGPGLPDGLRASNEPFVRALWAIAHLRKVMSGESEPSTFLSDLDRLPDPEERRLALAQLVYDLRVQANRGAPRSESAGGLPAWLKDAIVERAASPSTIDEMSRLVKLYSGPLVGSWAPSTHEELLVPIARAGKLDEASLYDVWEQVLRVRVEDRYASRNDLPLVQVWGMCAWLQDVERRAALLQGLDSDLVQAHRTLLEPFLSTRNHERWSKAIHAVLWILLRAWAIARARPAGSQESAAHDLVDRVREIAMNEDLVSQAIGELREMAEFVLNDLDGAGGGSGS